MEKMNLSELFKKLGEEIAKSPADAAAGAKEVCNEAKTQWQGLKNDIRKDWEELKNLFNEATQKLNIVDAETEFLKVNEIANFAKFNMVQGADSVAAFKQEKDGAFVVWLAYCKNGELLPKEQNTYVRIKTEGLARDVKDLFGTEECVILQ